MMSSEEIMYYMMRKIKSLGTFFFFFFNLARLRGILISINLPKETPRRKKAI